MHIKTITTQQLPMWFKYREKGVDKWYKYTEDQGSFSNKYLKSISYTDGLFNPKILLSSEVRVGNGSGTQPPTTGTLATLPIVVLRYNPEVDSGFGNEVYLTSIFKGSYDKPSVTEDYHFNGVPLWMAFFWLCRLFKTKK